MFIEETPSTGALPLFARIGVQIVMLQGIELHQRQLGVVLLPSMPWLNLS